MNFLFIDFSPLKRLVALVHFTLASWMR
jgi:hypothetical protein